MRIFAHVFRAGAAPRDQRRNPCFETTFPTFRPTQLTTTFAA
jgi:hypothetical protein